MITVQLFQKPMLLFFAVCLTLLVQAQSKERLNEQTLWFNQPAADWNVALPVGNGRLGAMVFGGVERERIQLNEESLWAGKHIDVNNPQAAAHLAEIQQLLLADSNGKAFDLSRNYLLATPQKFRSYQPLGDLYLDFGQLQNSTNYRRSLDLNTGISTTTYTTGDLQLEREVFASVPDDVIAIRVSANLKNSITCKITLSRERDASVTAIAPDALQMTGQIVDVPDSLNGLGGFDMRFSALLQVKTTGGHVQSGGNSILVTDADEVWIYITAATDYAFSKLAADSAIQPTDTCAAIIARAVSRSFNEVKHRHLQEYLPLMHRVAFQLGPDSLSQLPTDERLEAVKKGRPDNGLATLYFQYGRYLLLSSSRRPGRLPANLQGIWNEHYIAPWNSDYHTNINIQMNYWPAEVCNLSETTEALHNFIDYYRMPGRVTAQKMYSTSGWTLHHTTDVFGKTALMEGVQWGTSPLAAAWLCTHLWEHYLFTGDMGFLKSKGYPIMKEAAQFVQGFLIKDKSGYLVSAPSMSPENSFKLDDGSVQQLTYAPAIDIEIIQALFNACIEAGALVGESKPFIQSLQKTLKALPPVQVSARYGIVQEWIKDYEEAEPGHRHMSQLIGLYPFSIITPKTPELFAAARRTIERRLQHGGGHTGWSRAWIINFFARLGDGEAAHQNLVALFQKSTLPNLFDNHPPFQIDGNFGATAGIAEMLLQSHTGEINLLPALPHVWQDGYMHGLLARGGFEVGLDWEHGLLKKITLLSKLGRKCTLRYGKKTLSLKTQKGKTYHFNGALQPLK